jgi:hypothetical protein
MEELSDKDFFELLGAHIRNEVGVPVLFPRTTEMFEANRYILMLTKRAIKASHQHEMTREERIAHRLNRADFLEPPQRARRIIRQM